MYTMSVVGSGLEEVATKELDGVLYNLDIIGNDPRLPAIINEALAKFNDLPPNLQALLDTLKDQLSDASTITRLVELNPALAAKVLKLVNSSFAGLRGKVGNLKRAVTLLGFNTISSLLVGTSVFMRSKNHSLPSSLPLGQLWIHSVAVSQIAGAIGESLGNLDSSTLISAGLLHDAGKLVLAEVVKERFARCIDVSIDTKRELIETELEMTGITHLVLSGALGKSWNLPDRLWNLMLYQYPIKPSVCPAMSAALALAEYIARTNGFGSDGQQADGKTVDYAAKVLGVPIERAPRLVDNLRLDEIKTNCHLLKDE